jgi:methylenetetrahydrofolate reductase (NADPH)
LGAAASPFASSPHIQAIREHKKVNAGAQFFQTNVIFDVERVYDWLNALAQGNILASVYILAGITPLKSHKMAVFMDQKVPGIYVPESILKRTQYAAQTGGEQEERLQIALELIEKIRRKPGINGIHLMLALFFKVCNITLDIWDLKFPHVIYCSLLSKSYKVL